MHVREVPKLIFEEIVTEPQTVNVSQYFNEKYPDSLIAQQYSESKYLNDKRLLGESPKGCWLWLKDSGHSSSLSIYGSFEGVLTDDHNDEFGKLVAGEIETGTWALGSGNEYDQTLWIKTSWQTYAGLEKLRLSSHAFSLLGHIALRTQQMIESGAVEVSRFFDSDLSLEAQGQPGSRNGQIITQAFNDALDDLEQ